MKEAAAVVVAATAGAARVLRGNRGSESGIRYEVAKCDDAKRTNDSSYEESESEAQLAFAKVALFHNPFVFFFFVLYETVETHKHFSFCC